MHGGLFLTHMSLDPCASLWGQCGIRILDSDIREVRESNSDCELPGALVVSKSFYG